MAQPMAVTDASFDQDVLKSDVPVLVDFWAPWCAPCRIVGPIVEEIAGNYEGKIKVGKVNTDENPNQAGSLGIRGIPTLIIFKDGKEADRVVGAVPKAQLTEFVERNLN
ncbi:MAG TPA: thioredoxin [Bacteroidetes bacterium]|nr:thioredoxin-1 [bacterium BMS3Bbin04]HDO65101.1 thioredoxin [Bacteroidota bacterium]HEX04226.1 thioredoxin [Bacteroidota bacterium]